MASHDAPLTEEIESISHGGLVLHPALIEARLDGDVLKLTRQEFCVLLLLVCQSGRLVLRQEATRSIWQGEGPDFDRRLTVLISRLRAKLRAAGPYSIETVRKRGLLLLCPEPATALKR